MAGCEPQSFDYVFIYTVTFYDALDDLLVATVGVAYHRVKCLGKNLALLVGGGYDETFCRVVVMKNGCDDEREECIV